jgi:hypothetical protein
MLRVQAPNSSGPDQPNIQSGIVHFSQKKQGRFEEPTFLCIAGKLVESIEWSIRIRYRAETGNWQPNREACGVRRIPAL